MAIKKIICSTPDPSVTIYPNIEGDHVVVQSTGKMCLTGSCSPPVVSHPGERGTRHVHRDHLRLHRGPLQPLGALRVVELAGELLVVARLERINDDRETSVSFQQGFYSNQSVVATF